MLWSSKNPKIASAEQQLNTAHLMKVLEHGGFLFKQPGLSQLESIKEFATILNNLAFDVKKENIDDFCRNSKFRSKLYFFN